MDVEAFTPRLVRSVESFGVLHALAAGGRRALLVQSYRDVHLWDMEAGTPLRQLEVSGLSGTNEGPVDWIWGPCWMINSSFGLDFLSRAKDVFRDLLVTPMKIAYVGVGFSDDFSVQLQHDT